MNKCFLKHRKYKALIFTIVILNITILSQNSCSCEGNEFKKVSQSNINSEILPQIEKEISETDNDSSEIEEWQKSYAEFLRGFSILSDYKIAEFSTRDLDNSGIPELLIIQSDQVTTALLTVYSYNGSVYKIGDYTNPKIGVSTPRIPNNPEYSGVFTEWWGGGIEHYAYLTIEEGNLICEDLWYIDRTKEPPNQIEISSNTQLINESINAYSLIDNTENLLEMYLIEENNIAKILSK